jgi:putative ubiquitin-RnfH superfamily antitoxin RatB of RatAB toxin-antitoxin module
MQIAVTYADPSRQLLLEFEMPENTTAEEAIQRSGILERCPQIDLTQNKVGIFGKLVPLSQVLHPGDRVEIYRPAIGKPPKKAGRTGTGTDADADPAAEEAAA